MAEHGLSPRRALGQNFVVDPNTVRRIAAMAGVGAGDRVLEIGAGLGSLTLALAETGASVTAVEVDRDLAPVLESVTARLDVTVVEADATSIDWSGLLGDESWKLVANLPYNVATPLVLDLLRSVPAITTMLVMVQREVAERLAAGPGEPGRGIPSVLVELTGMAEVVGHVPASVFHPRPRVESALVRIERSRAPLDPDSRRGVEQLVRRAFGQRRKMLRRSLSAQVAPGMFDRAAVEPTARPEELDVSQWLALAAAVEAGSEGR